MPRMNILNTVEREAFESPPVFNSVQRKHYFDFPTELRRLAAGLRAPTHQLGFLLSAGYFKAAKSFFPPSAFHRRDFEYVARQLELEDPALDRDHQAAGAGETRNSCPYLHRLDMPCSDKI
jgi:hypothetical protein